MLHSAGRNVRGGQLKTNVQRLSSRTVQIQFIFTFLMLKKRQHALFAVNHTLVKICQQHGSGSLASAKLTQLVGYLLYCVKQCVTTTTGPFIQLSLKVTHFGADQQPICNFLYLNEYLTYILSRTVSELSWHIDQIIASDSGCLC